MAVGSLGHHHVGRGAARAGSVHPIHQGGQIIHLLLAGDDPLHIVNHYRAVMMLAGEAVEIAVPVAAPLERARGVVEEVALRAGAARQALLGRDGDGEQPRAHICVVDEMKMCPKFLF